MKSTKRLPNKFKVLLVKFYNRQQQPWVNSIVMKISYIHNTIIKWGIEKNNFPLLVVMIVL